MEAFSTMEDCSSRATPVNGKIIEYICYTLHHGRAARDSIKEVANQAKYLMDASSAIYDDDDDDELKDKLISATAEAEIAMAYNIKAAIKKLEYCSKVLTKLCTESPLSDTSNTKHEHVSTKPNSNEHPTKNKSNSAPLLELFPSPSPDEGRPNLEVHGEANGVLVIGSQVASGHLHAVDETPVPPPPENTPLVGSVLKRETSVEVSSEPEKSYATTYSCASEPQNPTYLPLTPAFEGLNSESILRPLKLELQDENPLQSESILEAHPITVNLEEKLKSIVHGLSPLLKRLQQKETSSMVESQTSHSESKVSTSRFPKLRGWEAKKQKLKEEGIEVDKCPVCHKFKRSAAAGKNMGRCRCLKREKVPQEVIRLKSKVDTPEDEYSWRKYGQKFTKRESNPRSYYRCTMNDKCPAKKHTERDMLDPDIVIVTYSGEHNHNIEVKSSRASKKSRLNPDDHSPRFPKE